MNFTDNVIFPLSIPQNKHSKGSYAIVSDNPSPDSGKQLSSVTIFPSSEVVIYTGRGFIKEIEILQGLINVAVANDKRVLTPTAEFWGTAWVGVSKRWPDSSSSLKGYILQS